MTDTHDLRNQWFDTKTKMTKINSINLKNYIGKKVIVFFRNLKKVEGHITYNKHYQDYPYGFKYRQYTKDGKILIDKENGWDILEILTEEQSVQYETPMKNQEMLKALDKKIKAAEEALLYLNQTKASLERVIANSKKLPAEESYKRVYGFYPETYSDTWSAFQDGYEEAQKNYKVEEYQESEVDKPKSDTLYELIADWWDEIFTNGNPSGQNIESLVEQIMKLIPPSLDEICGIDEYNRGWTRGYNYYRATLLKRLTVK